MSGIAFFGSLELGFIYSFVAMGIFISYRILDIADLTVDGSFTLGAATCAILTVSGHPFVGLFAGFIVGGIAGTITASLQTILQIKPILAGILTMTALYSINLIVMGGSSNVSLLGKDINTIYKAFNQIFNNPYSRLILLFLTMLIMAVLVYLFLKTPLGLAIRATGDNEQMVKASSINSNVTKTVGLAVANSLVSFSGALLAHYQLSSDVSMGAGMVVMGLASLIIGETITGKKTVLRNIIAVCIGSIFYRFVMALALIYTPRASDLKLISMIIVTIAITMPVVKEKLKTSMLRKKEANEVVTD